MKMLRLTTAAFFTWFVLGAIGLLGTGCTSPTEIHVAHLEITADNISDMVTDLQTGIRGDPRDAGKDAVIKALVALMGKYPPTAKLFSQQKYALAEQIYAAYFGGGSNGGGSTPAPTPTPTPGPGPSPSTWLAKLQNPMLFMGAPDYYFHNVSAAEARNIMRAVRDAGLTGVDFEFSGSPVVDEYNGKKYTVDLDALYRSAYDSFANYLAAAREYGLICNVKFLNSNQSFANTKPDSWWHEQGRSFVQRFGTANIICLPLNETDSRNWIARTFAPRTRSSVGTSIRNGLLAGGMPKSQLIGYGSRGDNGFLEHHPQRSDASDLKTGGHWVINCTDSGASIGYVYGSEWRQGGKAQVSNISTLTGRAKKAGVSLTIYGFNRKFDYTGLAAASSAWSAREQASIEATTLGAEVRRAAVVVGCRFVDPAYYGGWAGDCPGADVDAQRFAALCIKYGIRDTTLLLNEQATLDAAYSNAAYYVAGMGSNDLLVLFFSGHGGQTNDVSGDESDGRDETICLYDGELQDDWLGELLSRLPPGLRVFMVTDNCNSGSNYRSRNYARAAIGFTGQLIHYGGCDDGKSSYGDDRGGLLSLAMGRTERPRLTYKTWFPAIQRRMPRVQVPTYAEWGLVTDEFRNTPIFK